MRNKLEDGIKIRIIIEINDRPWPDQFDLTLINLIAELFHFILKIKLYLKDFKFLYVL